MKRALTFHVPPDAGPTGMRALLSALADTCQEPLTRGALVERMVTHMDGDARPRGEVLTLAQDIALLDGWKDGIRDTPRAAALRATRFTTDLLHGLQYFAWSAAAPAHLSRLWTYRTLVDLLWTEAPLTLDAVGKQRLVEDVLARSRVTFADVPNFDPGHTSIGPKSVDGVAYWLKQLTPPVLQRGQIVRRQTCPPPLLVLALAAVARAAGAQPGVGFPLTMEQRTTICEGCFLDPQSLDRMVDWTITTQPALLRRGTLISTYGQQLVLTRLDVGPEDLT